MAKSPHPTTRPVLYQLCRSGERFEVGDGPTDLSSVDSVVVGRGEPSRQEPSRVKGGRIAVDDPWMSSKHARVFRDAAGVFFVEDQASTNGVLKNGHLVGRERLAHGDIIETGRTFWLFAEEPRELPLPDEPVEFGTWSTWTPRLAAALKTLEAAVERPTHVLITGPEGSGKGFLARTVHLMSGRAGRLIHLDCRERRAGRLAVDLFGGEGQPARLREADLGTLFLENVDALPLDLQDRVADTLKKGGYIPDGKTRRVACDVRVIASSSVRPRDDAGRYSRRLLEVLGALTVDLPGLDERKPDLGLLLDDFLARARGAQALSRDACRAVFLHPWRQHVKAFARVVESAATLAVETDKSGAKKGRIELAHLPLEVIGLDALRALLPEPPVETRPPSAQNVLGRSGIPTTPPRQERRPSSGVFRSDDDDPETTSEVKHPALPVPATDEHLARAADEIRGMVDAFDDLGDTDPSQRRASSPPVPDRRGPGVRALEASATAAVPAPPQSTGAPVDERPPSAYHDLSSIERSYASAVDPDLIVDALRRARGNVSGAARYLGKPRALLLRWMREFGLNAEDYRTP